MMSDLKRIRELIPKRRVAARPDSFFYKFDIALDTDPVRRKMLDDVEADLACLDDAAWGVLKAQAAKYLVRNRTNGWELLFNTFNEAKGYRHLQALGCKDIVFVPPRYNGKTPDLTATLDDRTVLCEVKTVIGGGSEAKFLKILAEAKSQLDAFDPGARRIIYIVISDVAKAALDAALKTATLPGVDVEVYTLLRP